MSELEYSKCRQQEVKRYLLLNIFEANEIIFQHYWLSNLQMLYYLFLRKLSNLFNQCLLTSYLTLI